MNHLVGTSNRILEVDLSEKSFKITTIDENLRRQYLGAKGLGLKLLYDRMSPFVQATALQDVAESVR